MPFHCPCGVNPVNILLHVQGTNQGVAAAGKEHTYKATRAEDENEIESKRGSERVSRGDHVRR